LRSAHLLDAGHEGAEYVLTGPESLSQCEQVVTIGDVIGRSLRYHELTPEAARRELGFPAPAMTMLLDAWAAALGQPAFVNSTVAEILGRPPRTFRDWVSDHIEGFKSELNGTGGTGVI